MRETQLLVALSEMRVENWLTRNLQLATRKGKFLRRDMSLMFAGLRSRINLLILLAVFPAVALTVYVNLEQRQAAVSEVKNDLMATLRHIAMEEKHQTRATLEVLAALSHHPLLNCLEPARCSETLQRLLPDYPQFGNFAVFNSDGALSCSAAPFSNPDRGVSNASIERAIKTRRFVIGDCSVDLLTGQSSLWYGYPAVDAAEQVEKIVFAELKLDWFYELISLDRLKDQLTVTLLDHSGTIVAGCPSPESGLDKTLSSAGAIGTAQTRDQGIVEELNIDGTRKLHGFLPLEGAPSRGYVIAGVPLAPLFLSESKKLMRNLIILGLVTLAAVAAAGFFGQALIVRKMNMLVAAARQLSTGDYSVRSGLADEKGEFGQLGRAFDEMADAIEHHEAERNFAGEALRKSEANFRNLVENSLSGIGILQDGYVIFLNPELERLSGLPFQKARPIDFTLIHPEDVEKAKGALDDLTSGRVRVAEITFRFFRSPESAGAEAERSRWGHCRAHRILYQDKPSILVNMLDITQLKELEYLMSMQDKLASLGRVAAGIVHELRNPLSALDIYLANIERLFEKTELPVPELLTKAADNVVHLKSASLRMGAVIRKVTDFSRPGPLRLVPTDLNTCAEAALKYCKTSLRKSGIEADMALSKDLPECRADPFAMEQVMVNLIQNAVGVMKDADKSRKLQISTKAVDGFVVVRVSDSGPGVPLHLRGKIFDPFFSTKKDSMGIGLSICQRIVLDHGGSITVAGSEWGGAEFVIKIPIIDRSEA